MKSKSKNGKAYTIISENPKMDTSGMAGKPVEFSDMMMEYKPPTMPLNMMLSKAKETQPKK
jgi:hypothetical protein